LSEHFREQLREKLLKRQH